MSKTRAWRVYSTCATRWNFTTTPASTGEDRITPPEAAMKRLIALLVVLLIVPTVTLADGFIIINPGSSGIAVPRGHFPFAPLEVTYHRVSVEINDQVAITSVDQEFYNPNPQQLEGTYLFPLPAG